MPMRLARIELKGEALRRLSPALEADREQAISDLLAENRFLPAVGGPGPYALFLSIAEGRLAFDIRAADDEHPLSGVVLALGPFRGLIKDYLMMVDAHVQAVADGGDARIQAIDMGRRGLHNEAAELLMQRLAGKIEIDFDTARRLFTLVAVLHQRA
ncbi:MAG: UPF0262 family protein [Acetobacteraceae bacterium]|nr:UPF0262 family protein [Acetobacteraceae bacterium]